MKSRSKYAILAFALLFHLAGLQSAHSQDGVTVVATIKPIHSIVSAVMEGVAEPHLVMKGTSSPHTFYLRPSDARAFQSARVVLQVSDTMETSLIGPLRSLASHARIVSLSHVADLTRRPLREGGTFEDHEHESYPHGVASAVTYGESGNHEHHESESESQPHESDVAVSEEHHDEHQYFVDEIDEPFDMHIWLDPQNGIEIVNAVAHVLSEIHPEHADQYSANSKKVCRETSSAGSADIYRVDRLL